jgi:hypothetical protein
MEQQLKKVDTVNRIKAATTNEPQNTTQETYATQAKPETRPMKHDTGKEQRGISVRAIITKNYRQAMEHCNGVR